MFGVLLFVPVNGPQSRIERKLSTLWTIFCSPSSCSVKTTSGASSFFGAGGSSVCCGIFSLYSGGKKAPAIIAKDRPRNSRLFI